MNACRSGVSRPLSCHGFLDEPHKHPWMSEGQPWKLFRQAQMRLDFKLHDPPGHSKVIIAWQRRPGDVFLWGSRRTSHFVFLPLAPSPNQPDHEPDQEQEKDRLPPSNWLFAEAHDILLPTD